MQGGDDLQEVDDILDLINKIANGVQIRCELDKFRKEHKSKKDKNKFMTKSNESRKSPGKNNILKNLCRKHDGNMGGRTGQITQIVTKQGWMAANQRKPNLAAKQAS